MSLRYKLYKFTVGKVIVIDRFACTISYFPQSTYRIGMFGSTLQGRPPESKKATSFYVPSLLNRAMYPAVAPIKLLHELNMDRAAS